MACSDIQQTYLMCVCEVTSDKYRIVFLCLHRHEWLAGAPVTALPSLLLAEGMMMVKAGLTVKVRIKPHDQ